jgi:Arc/MetJ-type ribon-helix-helix transcriptional regulator
MEREITITVTDDEARLIEERVAAGEYDSAADLVHRAVSDVLSPPAYLTDDFLRAAIAEADADPRPDLNESEFFDRLHRHIDAVASRRDAKA